MNEVKVEQSEDQTITRSEKTFKMKDPKRVEAGKRLAAISKEAKEKKARKRINAENEVNEVKDGQSNITNIFYVCTVLIVGAGGLYFWKTANKTKPETKESKPEPEKLVSKLDSFDD